MIVLALDTTSQHGGAGIFRDGIPLAIIPNDSPANLYSVTLFDMTERAVQTAGISWREIDLFAVSNGPGSFTGIRVGLAAVQAWAKSFARPAVGVSNLRAMVQAANSCAQWLIPILDARRGEFYLGRFRRSSDRNEPGQPSFAGDEGLVVQVSELEKIARRVPDRGSSGTAWVARENDEAARDLRRSLHIEGQWLEVRGTLLSAIAEVAARQSKDAGDRSLDELQPCYIRRPDAELNWRG